MSTAIRGAINAENTKESILKKAPELYRTMIEKNNIDINKVTYLIISHTKDLRALNSATALRKAGLLHNTPLFCVQEADIENSMPLTIRMMLVTDQNIEKINHVYLGETSALRPDLAKS